MSLSVIIIEYNSIPEIEECLSALYPHLPNDSEVIISSNSQYSLKRQKEIVSKLSNVKWLFNERNGGFAYAMNQGLRHATKANLLIMNPDCKVQDNLSKLVDFLDSHPTVGAIAGKLVDEAHLCQDSARHYVTPFRFFCRQLKRVLLRKDDGLELDLSKIQTVDWVIGAFIMVSRNAYEKTGGLSDDYFMYAEDIDWCTRIRKAGFEIVYNPAVEIIYKGTRRARNSGQYAKIFMKSHFIYWKKFGFFSWQYPKRKQLDF